MADITDREAVIWTLEVLGRWERVFLRKLSSVNVLTMSTRY